MQPKNWTPRRRIETEYRKAIEALLDKFIRLPDHVTLGEINQRLVEFAQYRSLLDKTAARIAYHMVTQIKADNARSWQAAAQAGSRGREVYLALRGEMHGTVGERVRALVQENARLISSIPNDLVEHVSTEIADLQQRGYRPATIEQHIRRRVPELSRSRARLIARTESSKASTALTRARAENLGLGWYEWATSEDERVRRSHKRMDKVLVAWDDPPSPEALIGEKSTLGKYHAGNCPNCRCDSYPVLDLDVVTWPHRVYTAGKIQRLTRAQFRRLAA